MSDECMFGPRKSPKLVSKQSATFAGTTEIRDLPGLVVPLEISNLPLKTALISALRDSKIGF